MTAELIIADFNPDCHNDHYYIFTDLMIKRISDIKIKTGVKIDFGGSYNDLVKSYRGWSLDPRELIYRDMFREC